jgi:hypothetical protein
MVTLARTSANRIPGIAGDLRTRSEAVVIRRGDASNRNVSRKGYCRRIPPFLRRGRRPGDARRGRASPRLLLVQPDLGLHAPELDVINVE